ncbi:hypothetical protein Lesp02_74620 [Lentzea sp. NBRC 105346]|uniref:ABC transporter substrate-binding protein n=1 Tax=Lentzea sp. NBRC 105346 TaxID=3032205 RepID=UPI0024A44CAB|nr:ABC transporter substrate-binding protein [Lentzea sp. NBRC 105346]GLZ35275.1 hypothetical protein Lesp02_74620 [Lentzea sp. NBRC 105346]
MKRRSAVLASVAGLIVAIAPDAHAIDRTKGYPGFCKDDNGVTVVVDFQQLGGTTIVRCNPATSRGTGLDALKGAGFQVEGNQRFGESLICRVENRPSATETIPITGRNDYREPCADMPPAGAYWSYFHSGNNCGWEVSQSGPKDRDFVRGGFEGWSFSLNAKADSNTTPRIAPVRPGTENRPCDVVTSTKPDPKQNVEFTGGEKTEAIKQKSSDFAPWAAGAVVLVLAVAGFLVARRRKQKS